jgi:cation diffusion facilitator family transporter
MDTKVAHDAQTAHREKRLVALSSVLAAIGLTTLKIVVGVSTGSIGILSEAAHSGLDLVAAAVTFYAVRASGRPADDDHAYGHGKVENLSALFETGLLLVTCVWIVWESVKRLLFHEVAVEVTAWSFAVMVISIAVDWSRSRALRRAARKYGSQALEADALHFSTDIWSSSVVIVGLGGVWLANRLGLQWLVKADAIAALGVAAITVLVSLRLGRKSVEDLLDAAPPGLVEATARAARIPGVADVRHVRLRRSGAEVFADLTVEVARGSSFERAHDLADAVEQAVRAQLGRADVVVHVEPVAAGGEGALTMVRLAAARLGLGAHAIRLHRGPRDRALDVHLEVPAELSVGVADELVRRFEAEVRATLTDLARIHVHTEPVADTGAEHRAVEASAAELGEVAEALSSLAGAAPPEDLRVVRVEGGLRVSFAWALPPELSAAEARDRALEAERRLRERIPQVIRVLVRLGARSP